MCMFYSAFVAEFYPGSFVFSLALLTKCCYGFFCSVPHSFCSLYQASYALVMYINVNRKRPANVIASPTMTAPIKNIAVNMSDGMDLHHHTELGVPCFVCASPQAHDLDIPELAEVRLLLSPPSVFSAILPLDNETYE